MSCTNIAKYFPQFPICRGTVFAVPRYFYFGTFCPEVKARSVSTGPQLTGFGETPQQAFWQAFLPHNGAKISSVFTLELLAKNASVATLALLAVSVHPGKGAKNGGRVFYTSSAFRLSLIVRIIPSTIRSSLSLSDWSIMLIRFTVASSAPISG